CRVDAGSQGTIIFPRVKQQPAPPGANVDERLAGGKPDLAANVVHLVALRLFQRRLSSLPVRARVHHRGHVEPVAVERLAKAVVKPRIGLRLFDGTVRITPLVPVIAQSDKRISDEIVAAIETRAKREREVAIDVDTAVEISFENAHVTKKERMAFRLRCPE